MNTPNAVSKVRSDADAKSQFLNSVLSSIGNKEAVPPPPVPPISRPEPAVISQKPIIQRNGSFPDGQAASLNNKRKADDAITRPNDKALKGSGYRGTSSLLSQHTNKQQSSQAKKVLNASASATTSTPFLPHRAANKTPESAPPASASGSAPLATPPADGVKAPKKGSFAEIMARAKSAPQAPSVIGTIKHQPKDKNVLSHKRELVLRKRGMAHKITTRRPNGHTRSSSAELSSGSTSKYSGKPGGSEHKKAPEIAYKGTAKPKPQPSYKGTMKPATSTSAIPTKKPASREEASRYRYASYSDEQEEEDTEEHESDDMEAGFSDVEQEEAKASKLARREDEEEARKEAEHQARKKKLKELAKKAKPRKY